MNSQTTISSFEVVTDRHGEYRAYLPGAMNDAQQIHADTLRQASRATHGLAVEYSNLADATRFHLAVIEALASSAIEGIVISAADLLTPAGSKQVEIHDVPQALKATMLALDDLEATPIALHEALGGGDAPDLVGEWRHMAVWVGGRNPQVANFVPPAAYHVPRLMIDLENWKATSAFSGLALASLQHTRFETIHPFPDGNGRVGRALVQQTLAQEGVLECAAPLSVHLLRNRRHYYEVLDCYREGDVNPAVELFTEAAGRACEIAEDLQHFHDQEREWRENQLTGAARIIALRLLRDPVGGYWQHGEGMSKATYYRASEKLIDEGVAAPGPTLQKSRLLVDWNVANRLDGLAGLRQRSREFAAAR